MLKLTKDHLKHFLHSYATLSLIVSYEIERTEWLTCSTQGLEIIILTFNPIEASLETIVLLISFLPIPYSIINEMGTLIWRTKIWSEIKKNLDQSGNYFLEMGFVHFSLKKSALLYNFNTKIPRRTLNWTYLGSHLFM